MSSPPTASDADPTNPNKEHARDLQLARAALSGDVDARQEFARRIMVVGRILSVRNKHMGSPLSGEELADLAQETILKVWDKLETFEGRSTLETWAYRFCYLELMNAARKAARTGQRQVDLDAPGVLEPVAAPVRRAGQLDAYLKHLSGRESEVVRLRHAESLNLAETAAQLSISVSSAKTHYYRALEKLRGVLTPQPGPSA